MQQQQPKMSFCMPAYHCEKTIGRALASLFDQDYKNFEVIVCLDGEDKAIRTALLDWQKAQKQDVLDKIKIIAIEHAGACAARNAAAKLTTGEYISVFSSDFIAEPGMLRRWIEVFQENPEVDMVYGNYKFWDMQSGFYAEPFDPYVLTCYPYIDGGFPVKREVWEACPWDEDFKSLNDWEWTLRIALSGYKLKQIPDFSYAAQSPKPGGLSEDSSRNWLERVDQIRKKHGIPQRDVCFCSVMYRGDATKLAQYMGQDVQINPAFKPNRYKLIYQIGFDMQHADQCFDLLGGPGNAKRVVHWMPADVKKLKAASVETVEFIGNEFTRNKIMNFACTPEDMLMLVRYGFKTKLNYYPVLPIAKSANGEFAVWFPFDAGLADLTRGMPDIKVTTDRNESSVDVLLGAPWGDVAASRLAGKYVLTNAAYPGCDVIPPQKTYPELRSTIINMLRSLKTKQPKRPPLQISDRQFKKELKQLCR